MGLLCEVGKSINSATAVTFGKKGFLLVIPVLSTYCVYISILAQIRTVVQEWTFYSCHHMKQSYFHSCSVLRGCGTKICVPDTNEYSVLGNAAWNSEQKSCQTYELSCT